MKTFLEEYGIIVVAAIIIMIIIVAATPLGTSIRDGITSAADRLTAALGDSNGSDTGPDLGPEPEVPDPELP